MKVRNGFVSNSSSSSFCIIGIYTTEEHYDRVFEIDNNLCSELEFYSGDETGCVIGISPDILEDCSIKQAREIFKEKLISIIGKEYAEEVLDHRDIDLIYDSCYD